MSVSFHPKSRSPRRSPRRFQLFIIKINTRTQTEVLQFSIPLIKSKRASRHGQVQRDHLPGEDRDGVCAEAFAEVWVWSLSIASCRLTLDTTGLLSLSFDPWLNCNGAAIVETLQVRIIKYSYVRHTADIGKTSLLGLS